jgi:hypothetical protein
MPGLGERAGLERARHRADDPALARIRLDRRAGNETEIILDLRKLYREALASEPALVETAVEGDQNEGGPW